jgi:hypothetical protein
VFGPCILNLLVKFVSSHIESIKLQMPLREMKTTYYCSPLDNSSHGQPWCCRTLHHSLSAGSSYWIDFIVPIPSSHMCITWTFKQWWCVKITVTLGGGLNEFCIMRWTWAFWRAGVECYCLRRCVCISSWQGIDLWWLTLIVGMIGLRIT